MMYGEKQKFTINELVRGMNHAHYVVISEPDIYLAKLYEKYLTQVGISVLHFQGGELLPVFIEKVNPKVLLFSLENRMPHENIEIIRNQNPHIIVVTISHNADPEDVRKGMVVGVSSHINRALSRPKDVADIIYGLITI